MLYKGDQGWPPRGDVVWAEIWCLGRSQLWQKKTANAKTDRQKQVGPIRGNEGRLVWLAIRRSPFGEEAEGMQRPGAVSLVGSSD